MPRLFVGSYLNSEGVLRLQELARQNQHLGDLWNMRARWVSEDKLHLTWLFLGDVEAALVGDVAQALEVSVQSFIKERGNFADAGAPPLLDYVRFELWPTPRKARLGVIVPSTVAPEIPLLGRFHFQTAIEISDRGTTPSKQSPVQTAFDCHAAWLHNLKVASNRKSKSRASLEDVNVPASVFPVHQSIVRVGLIESDMGKKIQGYETIVAFDVV